MILNPEPSLLQLPRPVQRQRDWRGGDFGLDGKQEPSAVGCDLEVGVASRDDMVYRKQAAVILALKLISLGGCINRHDLQLTSRKFVKI